MKTNPIGARLDAYGQEMWAHFNGRSSYEIVERDDGFIDVSGGAKDYFAEFKDWPKHQREAMKHVRGRVLDVGAGAGRVSLYLQRKDLKVTAIDNSPLAVKVCKKRGVKDARVMSIDRIGIFGPGTFDSVTMYGNNFGLFGSPRKTKRLLKTLYRISTPEALIIAETIDPYRTDDHAHLKYCRLNRKRGRMPGQLRIRIRFRDYIGKWFDYLFVSAGEMKTIVRNTGWQVQQIFDSDAPYYIAILEKKQRPSLDGGGVRTARRIGFRC